MSFARMLSLHVAMQMGPSHDPVSWTSGVWSLRILISRVQALMRTRYREATFPALTPTSPATHNQSFLLISCTGRIVTAPPTGATLVAPDTQAFQHLARCSPHGYPRGGQRSTLGPFIVVTTLNFQGGRRISGRLSRSPVRSDYLISLPL